MEEDDEEEESVDRLVCMGLLGNVTAISISEGFEFEGIEGVVRGGLVAGVRRKLEGLGGM